MPHDQPHQLRLHGHVARILKMEKIEFKAMGCSMLAVLDSQSMKTRQRLERVPEWFEEWEQCLSRFREDSELSDLNRHTGVPYRLSKTLWDVFQAGRVAERSSAGLVTPAVLDALVNAGYDRTFEALGRGINSAAVGMVSLIPPLAVIEEDVLNRSIQLPEGMHLDFGGVAKGWAADQAVRRLQVYGPALVDASGDIAMSGPMADGRPWPIGLQNPLNPERDLCLLGLKGGGVATSGIDFRRWEHNGARMHHIIDPRTGLPAETDVLTATVIAPSVLEAETFAKMVLITGSRAGLAWFDSHPGIAGMVVLENGQVLSSPSFDQYLWRDT
jgi:thiamine biosynthesis lipoprotein